MLPCTGFAAGSARSPLLTQQTGQPFLKKGRISEIVRSRRFDVVHYHNVRPGPGISPSTRPVRTR
jgi:hypothetical protein